MRWRRGYDQTCRSTSSLRRAAASASRSWSPSGRRRPSAARAAPRERAASLGAGAAPRLVKTPGRGAPAGGAERRARTSARRPTSRRARRRAERAPRRSVVSGLRGAPRALVELYREASGCTRCPLSATRTNVVFGAGNADADLMFVGEAPGAEEDRQGLPFVGRAGQLLNQLLEGIEMRREDVFIANMLQVPPARQPRPAADRDRGLLAVPRRQMRADRAAGDRARSATSRRSCSPAAGPGSRECAARRRCTRSAAGRCSSCRCFTRRRRCARPRWSTRCARTSRSFPS